MQHIELPLTNGALLIMEGASQADWQVIVILLRLIVPLFRPMEFSKKLHTIKSEWYIVYIEGSQVIISQNI